MPALMLLKDLNIFPPPEYACPNGMIAVGGDLNTDRLLNAYKNGIFPWYNPIELIKWWCPRERYIIFPDKVHISRSMKKMMKKTSLEVKMNKDFAAVIRNCRLMREPDTWITDEMEEAYNKLYNLGHALSAEVYDNEKLVGGLYGVVIGKCFFGESMFSKVANASKLAFICLCKKLNEDGFLFIDCQFETNHLKSMGGQFVPWEIFKGMLDEGLAVE